MPAPTCQRDVNGKPCGARIEASTRVYLVVTGQEDDKLTGLAFDACNDQLHGHPLALGFEDVRFYCANDHPVNEPTDYAVGGFEIAPIGGWPESEPFPNASALRDVVEVVMAGNTEPDDLEAMARRALGEDSQKGPNPDGSGASNL